MSSSGPKNTTAIQKTEPPEYVKPYSIEAMQRAGELSNLPYKRYRGQQIAGLNPQQRLGLNMIQQRAIGGDPLTNAAQNMAVQTMQGRYMPRSITPAQAPGSTYQDNPYISNLGQSRITTGANPYSGSNPYLQQAIDYALGDITEQYQDVTAPQTAAAQVTQGAFGNTGLQELQAKQLSDFTKNLGRTSSGIRMADYQMQAQLAEQEQNRRLQADRANQALALSQAQMAGQEGQFSSSMDRAIAQQNAQLQQQALMADQAAYQQERNKQLQLAAMAPQLAGQRYSDARALMGVGDVIRDFNQQQMQAAYGDWTSAQQWPYQQLDVLQNAVRSAMGGGSTTTQSAPGASRGGNILGGALLGYDLGDKFGYGALGAAGGGLLGAM